MLGNGGGGHVDIDYSGRAQMFPRDAMRVERKMCERCPNYFYRPVPEDVRSGEKLCPACQRRYCR